MCVLSHFSRVQLFATSWPLACQASQDSLSMEFSRQEYCSGLPFPLAEDLPDPGIDPGSPALQADTLMLAALKSYVLTTTSVLF